MNALTDEIKTAAQQSNSRIARFPVYYGWVVMAVGTLGMIMTGPGQTYTVSIFIEHFIEDLGLSRSLVSTLFSAGTLVGGFTLPLWGRQIDRQGPRRMVTLISVIFGLACIYMGFVQNAVMLGFGFILLRMLGRGGLALVSQTVINQWWVRKRGLVIGISGFVVALLGMGAYPNLVYALIQALDWRMAQIILGLSLLIIIAPLGFLLFRNRPEDHQLLPDGVSVLSSAENSATVIADLQEVNWTLKEAMRTRVFWVLIIGLSSFSMLTTGLLFHLVSIFQNRGFDPSAAAAALIPFSIAISKLGSRVLTDRIQLRYILSVGLLLQAVSLISANILQGTVTALLFGIILGLSNGIEFSLGSVAWASYFGRKNLGSIFGFASAMGVVGAAFGPLPFGIVYDISGTYQPVLIVAAGFCVLLSLLALTVKKPKKAEENLK